MRAKPSDRNEAIVAYRDAGHTLRATAAHFGIGVERVRQIERQVRDYRDATERLKEAPDDLMLLARTGRLILRAAQALAPAGIHRIDQLRGCSFRDLIRMPNMGSVCVEQIVKLAAERGIEIK